MREDANAGDDSSRAADSAKARPAIIHIIVTAASTTTRPRPPRVRPSLTDRQAFPKLIDPKVVLPDFVKFTKFLYQVCQNYPPGNAGTVLPPGPRAQCL